MDELELRGGDLLVLCKCKVGIHRYQVFECFNERLYYSAGLDDVRCWLGFTERMRCVANEWAYTKNTGDSKDPSHTMKYATELTKAVFSTRIAEHYLDRPGFGGAKNKRRWH